MIFLLTIGLVSYMLALGLVFSRYRAVKIGQVPASELHQPSLRDSLSQGLDAFAVYIVFFCREAVHHGYVYLLLSARRLVSLAKKFATDIERVLGKVISSTKKRRRDSQGGATSLFLQEIKLHQAEVKRSLHS